MATSAATENKGGMIYELIGLAIGRIGAIGKDKKNAQQGFMYRGIDQVYNALNPVMAELGIFVCPEVLDQKREERVTKTGTLLIYTLLTMRFTAYAPDGSHVSMTVVGEGMDSGDKSSNKAMSVAMKYAMFQLFCIPTEELKDPDADVYTDILPRGQQPPQGGQAQQAGQSRQQAGQQTRQNAPRTAQGTAQAAPAAQVSTAAAVPQVAGQTAQKGQQAAQTPPPAQAGAQQTVETVAAYLARRINEIGAANPDFNFMAARKALIEEGAIEDIPSAIIKPEQAQKMMDTMQQRYGRKAG